VAQQSQSHCDIRISFATAFSNWRRKNKVPLKRIAKDLGVSISTVSSWELGERFPTGYNFEILVEYTGLPPCKLFCVMADKCVPADCLLAMSQLKPARKPRRSLCPARAG
jgi:transcriptional regulator with XRE-family HTH domain